MDLIGLEYRHMAQVKGINARVFGHLVESAAFEFTTTYEMIAVKHGLPKSGNQLGSTLSPILADIYRFCHEMRLPPLTSIVVRKSGTDAGLPGKGFWTIYSDLTYGDGRDFTRDEKLVLLRQFHSDVFRVFKNLNK